jgi:5-methylcytosine-specific restriction endonuclease McrA
MVHTRPSCFRSTPGGRIRTILRAAIGSPCPYCGEPMTADRSPTRDHIRPRSKGYTLADPANRVIVCFPCNQLKGSRSLRSFLFRLNRSCDPRAAHVASFLESLPV